jgi:septation ring formation regulator EzrA
MKKETRTETVEYQVYICEACGLEYRYEFDKCICFTKKCKHENTHLEESEIDLHLKGVKTVCSDCGKWISGIEFDEINYTKAYLQDLLDVFYKHLDLQQKE